MTSKWICDIYAGCMKIFFFLNDGYVAKIFLTLNISELLNIINKISLFIMALKKSGNECSI